MSDSAVEQAHMVKPTLELIWILGFSFGQVLKLTISQFWMLAALPCHNLQDLPRKPTKYKCTWSYSAVIYIEQDLIEVGALIPSGDMVSVGA